MYSIRALENIKGTIQHTYKLTIKITNNNNVLIKDCPL